MISGKIDAYETNLPSICLVWPWQQAILAATNRAARPIPSFGRCIGRILVPNDEEENDWSIISNASRNL